MTIIWGSEPERLGAAARWMATAMALSFDVADEGTSEMDTEYRRNIVPTAQGIKYRAIGILAILPPACTSIAHFSRLDARWHYEIQF